MNGDCPARATLEAFASSALTAADSARLETHIEGCASCAQQLDTITRSQLDDLMGAEAPRVEKASRLNLAPPKAPGTIGTFAGYDVTEIAGSGAMGVVLKAHDPTLQRTVAIKVLSPSRAWDEESAERFLREARTIAAIQHDHVVVVHTAGREKGLPYLVMPFHSDGTLEGFLERTPRLTPDEVIRVGIQLARALEVTHAQGVLHRDIKPSNILLEGGLERVRLTDFGLAHSLDSARNSVAGTPQYMSPEQARGGAIDVRSDLFGLGAVLFRLTTGEMVYAGKSAQEILQSAADAHVRTVRESEADLPPELAAVIDRLLAPRRDDRFASAGEVASALVHAANRRRRIVKRFALAAAGACLLVAATIGALDAFGNTAVVNTILCDSSGDAFFIRGKFGTYAELPDAVRDAQAGDIIEVRFSGERVMPNFRTGGKPIEIRAATGFTPLFYATNNAQPFILADGPLTLEGLTLMRRAKGLPFTALIAGENARVALLNCRLFRSLPVASDTLIKAGRLPTVQETERIFPPLIVLDAKSECLMRNCLILGSHAAGIALRGERSRAQIANSLFAIHRAFALRPAQGFQADLNVSDTLFLSETLIDISDPTLIKNFTAAWTNCFFDLPDGAVLRVMRHGTGNWLRNVSWHESNTVYAGPVDYVAERMERRAPLQTTAVINHHLFSAVNVRPAPLVHATDADRSGFKINFRPEHIGEGEFYNAFRRTSGYDRWRDDVRRFNAARQ